jgi:hypothetical protein
MTQICPVCGKKDYLVCDDDLGPRECFIPATKPGWLRVNLQGYTKRGVCRYLLKWICQNPDYPSCSYSLSALFKNHTFNPLSKIL